VRKRTLIRLLVNGDSHDVAARPYDSLNDVLRDVLGLTGTKRGCDTGGCGACTVLVEGRAVYSCMFPAERSVGKEILTIEGLGGAGTLHPLQQSFAQAGAIQCGYCTPGMILAALAILQADPGATEEEIREELAGNLCRCTGYVKVVEAVADAAKQMRGEA
jgi:aerobic-type carbon monoxide dehydrogenase small subunit (CoxS/CutS family)